MKKTDARKLSSVVQQHNRDLAVRLFNQGQTRKQIAEIVGVHYSVACRWIKAWLQGTEPHADAAEEVGSRILPSATLRECICPPG